ncbi:hypothetical protein P8917_10085 [Bacillus atrophaeus]|uniref:hypothetical protein n=1 Tax=Bacillus atrophaeus TaxID=1452 RepID=UPI00227E8862|nr:hypothetical protein [Bacillus atrophaeus]MCY8497748.1 hypothetical protein [Bacillus atrophaeus]MCY8814903.1 hypothetical protein [Bacillus atrophaeus]MCY8821551.1 hypothetical protein [Bacillus atrophaeus]MCY8830981.1 hypothetical protein [Bacillus atrophaeus]MCY8835240.1 hypothetical protein [Bacillus atrophaeus]
MSSNQLKKKLEKLQKLEQEIKEQEKKVEQDVGKAFLKAFDIPHEESDKANELIEELLMLYEEANPNENEVASSSENDDINVPETIRGRI